VHHTFTFTEPCTCSVTSWGFSLPVTQICC
jgi:hypothetical protein